MCLSCIRAGRSFGTVDPEVFADQKRELREEQTRERELREGNTLESEGWRAKLHREQS